MSALGAPASSPAGPAASRRRPADARRVMQAFLIALMNALTREGHRPTITDLMGVYGDVAERARQLHDELGASELFDNRPFAARNCCKYKRPPTYKIVAQAYRLTHSGVPSLTPVRK